MGKTIDHSIVTLVGAHSAEKKGIARDLTSERGAVRHSSISDKERKEARPVAHPACWYKSRRSFVAAGWLFHYSFSHHVCLCSSLSCGGSRSPCMMMDRSLDRGRHGIDWYAFVWCTRGEREPARASTFRRPSPRSSLRRPRPARIWGSGAKDCWGKDGRAGIE
ncbi:uncharacterized protein B0I36DRAFT_333871 [Microdochium trichocladiopsis]|uniref:Uncharacterized protein n=1 Tax=Microdochium trichocladiopsis TaxID=1682393 RepID=A0A9P8XVX3_9PEZI|nr:uncharacterized protein B0I36DRAFT_333871 [Microdochium trichocladiopsis]KAH7021153.1 hypothetical protein B0I36DRAFT_333871 [Microdochium trichocladiopsis]